MFRKKPEPKRTPPVYVPKYYVSVIYGDDHFVSTPAVDTEQEAVEQRDSLLNEVNTKSWVTVAGSVIRSKSVKSLRVNQTRRIPTRWI